MFQDRMPDEAELRARADAPGEAKPQLLVDLLEEHVRTQDVLVEVAGDRERMGIGKPRPQSQRPEPPRRTRKALRDPLPSAWRSSLSTVSYGNIAASGSYAAGREGRVAADEEPGIAVAH